MLLAGSTAAACESCPDARAEMELSPVTDNTVTARFALPVFVGDPASRAAGLLIEARRGDEMVGRYQAALDQPASGLITTAAVVDSHRVSIGFIEDPAGLELTVRSDTAGACAGPTGRAVVG